MVSISGQWRLWVIFTFVFKLLYYLTFFAKSMNFYVQKNNNAISILKEEDEEEGREKRKKKS